jgi:invasion protein IalB
VVCNTRLGVWMGACSLLVAAAAPWVVKVIAPGLAQQHYSAAVIMLRIMAPVLLLSGAPLVYNPAAHPGPHIAWSIVCADPRECMSAQCALRIPLNHSRASALVPVFRSNLVLLQVGLELASAP